MIENHLLICMTHFQSKLSGIFEMRQMIGRETVPQSVCWPIRNFCFLSRLEFQCSESWRTNRAVVFPIWPQPLFQIGSQFDEPSPSSFRFGGLNFDQLWSPVDLFPMEPLQFCWT